MIEHGDADWMKTADRGGDPLSAIRAAGFEPVGNAEQRPTHVVVIGRRGDAEAEFDVDFDGAIRAVRPIETAGSGGLR